MISIGEILGGLRRLALQLVENGGPYQQEVGSACRPEQGESAGGSARDRATHRVCTCTTRHMPHACSRMYDVQITVLVQT